MHGLVTGDVNMVCEVQSVISPELTKRTRPLYLMPGTTPNSLDSTHILFRPTYSLAIPSQMLNLYIQGCYPLNINALNEGGWA